MLLRPLFIVSHCSNYIARPVGMLEPPESKGNHDLTIAMSRCLPNFSKQKNPLKEYLNLFIRPNDLVDTVKFKIETFA